MADSSPIAGVQDGGCETQARIMCWLQQTTWASTAATLHAQRQPCKAPQVSAGHLERLCQKRHDICKNMRRRGHRHCSKCRLSHSGTAKTQTAITIKPALRTPAHHWLACPAKQCSSCSLPQSLKHCLMLLKARQPLRMTQG